MRSSRHVSTVVFLPALAVAFALAGLPATAPAATWHVPDDAPTIQAGIDSASAGDTVLVAAGTYYENLVMKAGTYVLSETGDPSSTVVDASGVGWPVAFLHLAQTTYLEGFTITDGHANYGGGVVCIDAAPEIINCWIVDNHVNLQGGGILCEE